MQKVFLDTRELDAKCRGRYALSEDVMMENAAAALEGAVRPYLAETRDGGHLAVVLAGSGNNGADGYALARRLAGPGVRVAVCAASGPKSALCTVQCARARAAGAEILAGEQAEAFMARITEGSARAAVVVDCLFGSGFHGSLGGREERMVRAACAWGVPAVSCDVPSGLDALGNAAGTVFRADVTVTMGALKLSLLGDAAKDAAGRIVRADLGVSRERFEEGTEPAALMLEPSDLRLPFRRRQDAHKGSFGHVAVVAGEKPGAALLAGSAALRFGAGLVTVAGAAPVPPELMSAPCIPDGATAVALGMGLGRAEGAAEKALGWLSAHAGTACVADADLCHAAEAPGFLEERAARGEATVVTPHPKEFAALLASCGLGTPTVQEAVRDRVALCGRFCRAYEGVVLVLKGATPLIAQKPRGTDAVRLFLNPLGTAALAKAGSGDVLAGLTAALLAQGREPLEAAVQASLAHALASCLVVPDYALTPPALIDAVARLGAGER